MFQTSVVFEKNFTATRKKVVNQGGTSSGKTYSILQVLFIIACQDPGCVITVAGQDIPNLKKGAIRDAQKIVASSPALQSRIESYNKSDRIYEFNNGSIMEFNSYDDEQDAKSGKRDYLFVNEANGIPYEIYFQLSIRTRKREFLDYNPTAKFWVHERMIGNGDVQFFISDHRHNPFLSKEQHDEIEGIADEELWKVYARGLTGRIKGLIYPSFKIIDDFPYVYRPVVYGLDFGFNHKTALVEVTKDSNRLFWNELIYQSELTIGDLIQLMKELGLGKKPIYADHAAADKIEDLKRAGFNVHKADKDVANGIDFVKRNNLYITKASAGLRKEAMSYKWKEDKNGVTLDEPVKFNDDGMDAGRYGSYTGFRKNKTISVATSQVDEDPLDWV
jgi:phage terminase large subunit